MNKEYEPVIGMEIHAELKSERKMFCGCLNNPEESEPNINICPVCLAHPGVLPVANKKAIEEMIKIGLALEGKIAETARFYRKNYFYPDLPKGYQITSQPEPFVIGGELIIEGRKIKVDHIHLEEDTGTLTHTDDCSLVNFNRAGVPLMELVTEPVLESGLEARKFCEELQLILRYLKASEANMEKGEMRCEVNISLREKGVKKMGTKAEIKNLNSFRAVEGAVEYEIKRQTELLEAGEEVVQETRGWDEIKGETFSQRKKEEAHDYRYFPEPDLPVYKLADFDIEKLREELPELPEQKRERLQSEYDLSSSQVEILVLDAELAHFFEKAGSELRVDDKETSYSILYNYLVSDLKGHMKANGVSFEELKVTAENFVDLIELVQQGKIGSRVTKDVLKQMFETGADPVAIIQEQGLEQVSDESELKEVVEKIIEDNPKQVEEYKGGKEAVLKYLIGQTMRELKGKGDPQVLDKIFKDELNK